MTQPGTCVHSAMLCWSPHFSPGRSLKTIASNTD
jgi:hypothetical protein